MSYLKQSQSCVLEKARWAYVYVQRSFAFSVILGLSVRALEQAF